MVRATRKNPVKAGASLLGLALMTVLLSACSGRDTELTEKVAAAEQMALRAEKAAKRAEQAAKKAEGLNPPAVEAEPEDPSQAEDEGDGTEPTDRS
jgi:hypothetical protein